MIKNLLVLIFISITFTLTCNAWVYPEHREITWRAIQKLDSTHRSLLDRLWALARKGHESRLSQSVADDTQNVAPLSLDYTAWPAIGGDHSTSSQNLLYNILQTQWILDVAGICARLKTGLDDAKNRSERINRLRDSDIRLLRADPEYVSRAGANNGHFMLARPAVNTTAEAYFDTCFKQGCELNPVGTWKWFHASALLKALRLSSEDLTPGQRSELALNALADEAFALHFLEDGFASGHVAGVWGDASQRKGTHDYYDEKGLEVTTWQGDRLILMGDAYMRPEDADRAAETIRMSLEQFLDVSHEKIETPQFSDEPEKFSADTFNVSKAVVMPARTLYPAFRSLFNVVLINTPVPGLATGLGELPRFRSELGPFIGIAPAARVSVLSGGFGIYQNTAGIVPALELGIRIGLGMEGVLNESGDGLVFLDLGWRQDGASTMKFDDEPETKFFGSILSAIPSRDAFYARLRLPFYLIPGDLIILAPIFLLASPATLNKMIVAAGNGGLIPWQTGMVTPVGRFQFILGREIGVCVYGSGRGADAFLLPYSTLGASQETLFSMYSTQIEFPILEYRPFRKFSSTQSASIVLQINAGLDIPGKVKVTYPDDAPAPEVKTTFFIGVRLAFDWRYYFHKKRS
ncbi:MAG: hypothetical protein WCI71_01215 [Bacteroidota bacterium]